MTNPCSESSLTRSHLPKPCMRKHHFQNKTCCSRKYTTKVSEKIWDYPPRRMRWRTFQNNTWAPPTCNCRTISQHHSTKNHPVKFLSQPCSFSFNFSCHAHTHLISRLPDTYEMHYAISTIFMQHMPIPHHAYIDIN